MQVDCGHVSTLSEPSTTLRATAGTQHGCGSSTSHHKLCVLAIKCQVYCVHAARVHLATDICTSTNVYFSIKQSTHTPTISLPVCKWEKGTETESTVSMHVCLLIFCLHQPSSQHAEQTDSPLSPYPLILGGDMNPPEKWWSARMSHDIVD